MSGLVSVIVVLVVLGLLVWAFDRYVPVAQPFKGIVIFLLILIAALYLLRAAGVA